MIEELLRSEKLRALEHILSNQESVLVEELWNSTKALVAALAQKATGKHVLILTGASQEEIKLFHDFTFFDCPLVVDFPAWETLPSENIPPSPDIVGERYKALEQITSSKQPLIILSTLQACLQRLIPKNNFQSLYLSLKVGDTIPYQQLIDKLIEMGYQRKAVASDKGEFAIRGGIVDVFPVASPDPFRIEFWGDDIESLRIYDPIGQKSVKQVQNIEITPAQELELIRKNQSLETILDYLGPNTIVIFDDLLALEDKYATLVSICGIETKSFSSIEQFLKEVEPLQKIFWSQNPIEELSELQILTKAEGNYYSETSPSMTLSFEMFNRKLQAKRWIHPFVSISNYIKPDEEDNDLTGQEIFLALSKLVNLDCTLHILCSTEHEQENFHKRLIDAAIILPKHTRYHIGYLSSGLVLNDIKEIIFPLTEMTQRYKIRRQKQRSTYHTTPSEIYDLSPGEMVVHLNNGIGKFLGLEKRPNINGNLTEFFLLEYADNAKLYVPLNQAHLVSKYIGSSEELPKMHTLGSSRWQKTKEHTQRAIMGFASDLLELYAKRTMIGGFSYSEDSPEMNDFEEDFPYVETEDQLEAITYVKKDMISNKAMDRLICGDVGYGKTEVAMRAAFKAVLDGGKQVAVLVPTTVLAMQHFENFQDRMSNFPVNIAVLSRFRTPKQTKETLEAIAKGTVDIVIGTHRIVSKDVHFKNLGLIIIDEEQRFGVKTKEHLKKFKVGVDCLTLSATPIPRTLYMSLIGARDMSVISTPPQDRLPITTIITEPQDQILRNALLRELTRDGQAYIIHNRVETIYSWADRIKKLLPQARIVVGHGQMSSDELDTVFHAFKSGKADILIATTIVENGIDIPNANTIIIDRADTFGLADLYQLRGRVGRWNRRAYAYFLVPSQRSLSEASRKRLSALAESSGYGGGMKIAMKDLEIRGAGNIIGEEQSGHVSSIGFHLYCKLLKRTIKALQGKIPSMVSDTRVEIPMDARLPEEYVSEPSLRMEIYQRLGEALSFEEVDEIWKEIQDRFGKPPEQTLWLYHLTRVRVFASRSGITLIKMEKLSITIEKHNTFYKKVLLPKYRTPQEFEDKIIKILKEP